MSDLLQKIAIILTGLLAFWFSFAYVNQPLVPLYHNIFLFMVSWMLFYSFVSIAFQPMPVSETLDSGKKRQKIKRKNNATLEKS